MNKVTRLGELISLITTWNREYYEDSSPSVSDAEYDKAYTELVELEKELDVTSPLTSDPGSDSSSGFEKAKHDYPMLSIQDVFSKDELASSLRAAHVKVGGADVFTMMCTPKYDGAALSIIVKDSKLVRAVTRGDGTYGDDVTSNALNIINIDFIIRTLGHHGFTSYELRGEAIITKPSFEKINARQEELGENLYANPRNLASGTLKSHDPKVVGERYLKFLPYAVMGVTTEVEIRMLSQLYVPIGYCRNDDEINEYIDKCREQNSDIPLDGVVVKVLEDEHRETLGMASKHPKWAWAFKYPPEVEKTTIEDIVLQVGRTGTITPVAIVAPVHLAGTVVKRATLHNGSEIARKNINIGDEVSIIKSGEIIPMILEVTNKNSEGHFDIMEATDGKCPCCDTRLTPSKSGIDILCPNKTSCPDQLVEVMNTAMSRSRLDIDSIGPSIVTALLERAKERGIRHWIDILSWTEDDLQGIVMTSESGRSQKLGEKRIKKIVDGFALAKTRPFDRWLVSLSIPNVGSTASKEVARICEDWSQLTTTSLIEELKSWREGKTVVGPGFDVWDIKSCVGNVVLSNLCDALQGGFQFDILRQNGIVPHNDLYCPIKEKIKSSISDKVFVITGKLDHPRTYYKEKIESAGAKLSGGVNGKTDYLIAGDGGGSKRTKAESLNIPIISLDEFETMMK